MKKALWILGGLVALAIIVGSLIGLYYLGSSEQSDLERLRDVVIVVFGIFLVLAALLTAALIGALVWLVLTLRGKLVPLFDDKVSPLLDTLGETASRVKGTAEFMSEEVASPVISFYGTIAKARAMTRVVTGKDRKSGPGLFTRLRKR
ncbi:MAG TPA: hypothetical protein VMM78_05030 [Thermomicrobiales bacterium]|nr:hypothetical protein [Thermomicrobiales bacterium]